MFKKSFFESKNLPKIARSRRGMTLMEIMVVIAIIGTVMTVVGVNVMGSWSDANVNATQIQMGNIHGTLTVHRTMNKNKYPSSLEDVKAKLLNGEVPMDAWGNPFEYSCSDDCRSYKLTSLGEDGKSGGSGNDADIVSNNGKVE